MRECIYIALEDEDRLLYTMGIYCDVAKRLKSSWKLVEQNIRTACDYAWANGSKEELEKLSGAVLTEKPTASELIEIFVCYLQEHKGEDED